MVDILTSSGFSIMQNNKALPEQLLASIQQVTVEDELNVPSMFRFSISMINFNKNTWQGINLETFKLGDVIKVSMGLAQLLPLVIGQICVLEPTFEKYSTLEVIGYDRLYLFNFGTQTKVFTKITDSTIAAQIAQSVGLIPKVEASNIQIPYLLQNNQTNYSFLKQRCDLNNYEMSVNDKEFFYRSSKAGQTPIVTFLYGVDLIKLHLRLKILTQSSQIDVVGWDQQSKNVISGQAATASPQAKMGGTQTGNTLTNAFPTSSTTIENLAIVNAQDAKIIAQAQFNQNLIEFIEGEGECVGNTKVRAGVNIQINGLGDRFSGIYYVISSAHIFDYNQGYRTRFKVRRSGV